jgi:hypothetical protein
MMTLHTIDSPSMAAHHVGALPRPSALRTVTVAVRSALQWRLLLWWLLLLALPTFVASLPMWQMLGEYLDHSIYAPRLAEALDGLAVADLMTGAREHYASALGAGAIVAALLTLLLSPLLASMTLAAARARDRLGFLPLLANAAQGYGRMLRMLLVAIVPLGIAGLLSGVAVYLSGKTAETALLENDAVHASHLALGISAVLLLFAHATIDNGRALLGNDRRRRSAWLAWWHGWQLLVRRPLAVLGTYFVISALGLALAALIALARMHVPALGGGGTLGAIILAQLGVLVLGWTRSARLFALMALARDKRVWIAPNA